MASDRIEELVERAGFIFSGAVVRVGAAAMAGIPVDEKTAIVRVEEVLRAPLAIGDQTGRAITVRLAAGAEPGQSVVFFATGWMIGEGFAVQELGQRRGKDMEAVRKRVADALEGEPERSLERRVAEADLIVLGKVAQILPSEVPARITEHDPRWWVAVVEVETVEWGKQPRGRPVMVAFPTSDDVMWYGYPRPVPGAEAVWLLRKELPGGVEGGSLPRDAYIAVHELDVQPRTQLDHIREIVQRIQ